MYSDSMIGLDFARVVQDDWNRDSAPIIDRAHETRNTSRQVIRSEHVWVPPHRRLTRQIATIGDQIPTRRETMDWLGRRLITWGWQLRIRHGAPKR